MGQLVLVFMGVTGIGLLAGPLAVLINTPVGATRIVTVAVATAFLLFIAGVRQTMKLDKQNKAVLKLFFGEPKAPFVQDQYIDIPHRLYSRLFRVAISGPPAKTLENVVVELESFSPHGAPFLPQALHPMKVAFQGASERFQLDPKETTYVDVISWIPKQREGQEFGYANEEKFVLHFHNPGGKSLPNQLEPKQYQLRIIARAKDVQPAPQTFEIWMEDGEAKFRQVDDIEGPQTARAS